MPTQAEIELAISKLENIASHAHGAPRKNALLHAASIINTLARELKESQDRAAHLNDLLSSAIEGLCDFNNIPFKKGA